MTSPLQMTQGLYEDKVKMSGGCHGYLLDVGDVQRCVDQPLVHWMFSVFAFLVQVHCLQVTARRKKSLNRTLRRRRRGR